jgi:hypothetical protein
MVFRTRRQPTVAHRFQYPTELRRIYRDAIFVVEPTDQVYQPPPYDAVDGRNGATFNHLDQGFAMVPIKFRPGARSLPVDQAQGPFSIKSKNPVAQYLKADTASRCGV